MAVPVLVYVLKWLGFVRSKILKWLFIKCCKYHSILSYTFAKWPICSYVHLYLKQFVHGRTETTRTVSMESQAFLQAMGSTSMAKIDDYETTKHKKLHLLRRAAESHQKYTKSARHLFGLSQVLNEDELIPELSKIVSAFNRSKHRWAPQPFQLVLDLVLYVLMESD